MTKKLLIGFVLSVACVFLYRFCAVEVKAQERLPVANNVFQVYVTDTSRYIVDKRYNLCFYETAMTRGISVVQVSRDECNRLQKVEKGE